MEKHIVWLDAKEKKLEKKVLAEYSSDEVRRHLEYLTTLTRMAGTEDELRAARYITGKLDEYGVDSDIYEFDAYISHPGKAELEILSPVQKSFPCLPNAFIASTPPAGIEAELMFLGNGLEADYQGVDARGKIVIGEPGTGVTAQVDMARIAEENGAVAQIHISHAREREIRIMQLRNTWGSPTPETMDKVPQTPVISICNEDGKYLTGLTKKGSVVARLKADAWRGYKKIIHPIGTLRGVREPEKYVLFGAHYCSWYIGATDNAVANALLLEMARIFSKYRKGLGRGIRFAWWAGHTQGTYAGSTWYLDNFWEDVRDNALAYLNMDGLGKIGSSGFEARNTEDIRKFNEIVIKEALGLNIKSVRVTKIGDQSFWGMGLPSSTGRPVTAMGGGWYNHTVEDTLDKVDMEGIIPTFKVNAVSILRLCNNPILPFEFVTTAQAFKARLSELQNADKSDLDLASLMSQVEALEEKVKALNRDIERTLSAYQKKGVDKVLEGELKEINTCLMKLSRILIPALYSKAGKYNQDPMGSKYNPIPTLQPLEELNLMDSDSEEYKALRTSLVRERNKLSDDISLANRILFNTLDKI
ncbi:M28 family peptidase [Thermodesulfobacteriota bacterium]